MQDESRTNVIDFHVSPIHGPGPELADSEDATPWEQVTPRHVEPEDWLRFKRSMAEIFAAFGMNLDTPDTVRTPERFLQALYGATAGYEGDHTW
jgi:GTP cyclohydrolase I